MFGHHFPCLMTVIRPSILIAAIAIPSWADSVIKIGSVSPAYFPTAGNEAPQPVAMRSFSFEVEPETGRARVVVEYTYPDQVNF